MKHLKSFALFESKTHSLELPTNENELAKLKQMPSFRNLQSLIPRMVIDLNIIRGGSIRIDGPSYDFKITKNGVFYYGAYQVGPQNAKLDTWDKVFDYVYIYYLANALSRGVKSSEFEDFVFGGIIGSNTYNKIKGNKFYQNVLELSRKYNGDLADQAVTKAMAESDKYISDPMKVLETPSYKFFDSILDFSPSISDNDPYELVVTLKNVTPLGVFNKGEGLFLNSKIDITLEGSPEVGTFKTKVKTFKGLDKAFLNKIKEFSKQTIATWRMDEISVIKSNTAIQILKDIIAAYESGDSYTPDPLDMVKAKILEVLNNWDYNKIEEFFKTVSELLGDKDLRVIVEEYANSESGKSKMRKMLLDLKNNNVLDYAKVGKEWGNNPIFADVFSDIMRDDASMIKGGSMMRRFGFGDDKN
jgi:hypothetical protein